MDSTPPFPAPDPILPTDPTHAYWQADAPDHARAVQEVQAKLRAEAPARLPVESPAGLTPPQSAEPNPLAPYTPDAVALPALPADHAWDEARVGQFSTLSQQIGLNHAQVTGLLDFAAAWLPTLEDSELGPRAEAAFQQTVARLGISPDQARQLLDFHRQSYDLSASSAPSDAALATLDGLRGEWGAQFPDKLARAKTAVRSLGGAEIVSLLDETGLGDDPRVIRMFERFGALLDRERTSGADHTAAVDPGALSRDAAERLIREILDDAKSPYYDAGHPRHRATVEHVRRLYARAYPAA
jgi:hypothetical protein